MSDKRSIGWQTSWKQRARNILGGSSRVTAEWILGYQAGANAMYEDMIEDGWRKVLSIEEMNIIFQRIDYLLPNVIQKESSEGAYTSLNRVKAQALRYLLIGTTAEDK